MPADVDSQNEQFLSTTMLKFMTTGARDTEEAAAFAVIVSERGTATQGSVPASLTVLNFDEAVRTSKDPCARFLATVAAASGERVEELAGLSDWQKDVDKQLQALDTRVASLRDEAVKQLLDSSAKESKLEMIANTDATNDNSDSSVSLEIRDSETASRLRDLRSGDVTAGLFDRFSALLNSTEGSTKLSMERTLVALDTSIRGMVEEEKDIIRKNGIVGSSSLSLSHRLRAAMEEALSVAARERRSQPLLFEDVVVKNGSKVRSSFAELVGLLYMAHGVRNGGLSSYLTSGSISEMVLRLRVSLQRLLVEMSRVGL